MATLELDEHLGEQTGELVVVEARELLTQLIARLTEAALDDEERYGLVDQLHAHRALPDRLDLASVQLVVQVLAQLLEQMIGQLSACRREREPLQTSNNHNKKMLRKALLNGIRTSLSLSLALRAISSEYDGLKQKERNKIRNEIHLLSISYTNLHFVERRHEQMLAAGAVIGSLVAQKVGELVGELVLELSEARGHRIVAAASGQVERRLAVRVQAANVAAVQAEELHLADLIAEHGRVQALIAGTIIADAAAAAIVGVGALRQYAQRLFVVVGAHARHELLVELVLARVLAVARYERQVLVLHAYVVEARDVRVLGRGLLHAHARLGLATATATTTIVESSLPDVVGIAAHQLVERVDERLRPVALAQRLDHRYAAAEVAMRQAALIAHDHAVVERRPLGVLRPAVGTLLVAGGDDGRVATRTGLVILLLLLLLLLLCHMAVARRAVANRLRLGQSHLSTR